MRVKRVAGALALLAGLAWAGLVAGLVTAIVPAWPWLLGLVCWSLLVAGLIAVATRSRPVHRPAPTEIRPGDPVVGLPPRNPYFLPRSLPETLRALTGPPGIGKSQTAYEYAHRRLEDFQFVGVVHAARPDLIPDAYADFAVALRIAPTSDPVAAVHAFLASRAAWLIIFDDAGEPAELAAYLPPADHYLVTSNSSAWDGVALQTLDRKESMEFLRDRTAGLDRKDASGLAEALGDFPLALELAGGYLEVTGMESHAYLTAVRTQISRIRRGPLPALWSLSAQYLRSHAPTAFEALETWAVLGTEPIPLALFGAGADAGLVARLGLAVQSGDHVIVHPLVQELVRSGPDTRRRAAVVRAAASLRAYLTDATDTRWRALLPHVYAITSRPELTGDRTASWLLHHMAFLEEADA
jgi:hypothetical protein